MILITTALEESWSLDKQVLFLGEWCKLYNRRHKWSTIDSETLPYHWDDRRKLKKDFERIQDLNDRLISELAQKLNELHSEDNSVRYWRIVLGYWLSLLTAVLFDRWEMIHLAMESAKATETIVLQIPQEKIVSNDLFEFNKFIVSDFWNHAIYGKIIEKSTTCKIYYRDCLFPFWEFISGKNGKSKFSQKEVIKSGLNWFSCLTSRETDPFIIKSYLPLIEQAKLYFSLGAIPKLWSLPKVNMSYYNAEMREWHMQSSSKSSGFEEFVRALVPKLLPRVFVEGYKNTKELILNLEWPEKPKFIFTANSHFYNEPFKIWAAEKVDNGAPLITVDHGGLGTNDFNGAIEYQLDISDISLSWGWEDKRHPQVKPFTIIKTIGKNQNWNPNGRALMVEVAMPRYSFDIRSMVIAGQMIDYFNDQYRFYELLPKSAQNKILIRLYPTDNGWCQKERWKAHFPEAVLDVGNASISKLIKKTRVFISTYNATTYLESLSLNIPTIMFWNPNHWELRSEAIPYFMRLKEVGIFHETPESAASKVADIWDDVTGWWMSSEIQDVRDYFCHCFSRKVENPIKLLKESLIDASA